MVLELKYCVPSKEHSQPPSNRKASSTTLSCLQTCQNAPGRRSDTLWRNGVEQIAYLLITRYLLDPKKTLRIVLTFAPLHVRWYAKNDGDCVKNTPNG